MKLYFLYRKTTRGTIQAMHPFEPHKVDTIGEREIIDYIKKCQIEMIPE